MILTLKELGDYLRVNERTILRMLKSGQIQGAKIGGQWRFSGSQIDALFFPDAGSDPKPGDVPLASLVHSHVGVPISRVMDPERMVMNLTATDVEGTLGELASREHFDTLLLDVQDLQERLLARERLLSTGVGAGIALPHPRDPIPTLRRPGVIVFGRSEQGIDFDAPDGQPVHLFFLLCCQSIQMHLHLMGRLAQLLRNDAFVPECKTCATEDEVMRLVLTAEREQFLNDG